MMPLYTIGQVRRAVRYAKTVYMVPLFFGSETYLKISKLEVLYLLKKYNSKDIVSDLTGNPDDEDVEFGSWDGKDLYLN